MSIRTSITSRLCNQTNCIGGIYPFFRRKSKSIKTCLFFKPLEFEGFKRQNKPSINQQTNKPSQPSINQNIPQLCYFSSATFIFLEDSFFFS